MCSPDEEKHQPGAEHETTAAERELEQEEPRGGQHGQTSERTERSLVEEESCPTAEREPSCECRFLLLTPANSLKSDVCYKYRFLTTYSL